MSSEGVKPVRIVAVLAMMVAGCNPPAVERVPAPEEVCDLAAWRRLQPPAAWTDSLVAERDLDTGFVRLSSPMARGGPPPAGWAVVGTVVTPEGAVADAAVMRSSGTQVDSLAQWIVLGSRYSPPRRGGVAVWAFVCSPVVIRIV